MNETKENAQISEKVNIRRAYIANDIRVTRELFIMYLSLAVYNKLDEHQEEPNPSFNLNDFKGFIDEFIKGDNADTIVLNNEIFDASVPV